MANQQQPKGEQATSPAPQGQGQAASGGGGSVEINRSYLKSIPAAFKAAEFLVLMMAFSFVGNVNAAGWGQGAFFLFITVTCWMIVIVLFVIFLLKLDEKFKKVPWNIVHIVNNIVWAFLLLIASSVLADNSKLFRCSAGFPSLYQSYINKLYDNSVAGSILGFFSLLILVGDAVYHYLTKIKKKENADGQVHPC